MNDNLIASEPEKAQVRSAVEPGHQQLILATGDGAVLAAAFALVMGVLTVSGSISAWALLYTVAAASIGLLSLRLQDMWSLHKSGVRSAELTGLLWTSVAALVGVAGIDRWVRCCPGVRSPPPPDSPSCCWSCGAQWRGRTWRSAAAEAASSSRRSSSALTIGRWSWCASPRCIPRRACASSASSAPATRPSQPAASTCGSVRSRPRAHRPRRRRGAHRRQ